MAEEIQWDQVKGWQEYWDWAKRQFLAGVIDGTECERLGALCKQKIKDLTVPPVP